ncbi:hypothetical protein ACE6H2_017123 [Prunus campanulata]
MDSSPCLWWLLILGSIVHLVQQPQLLQAHRFSFTHHPKGPFTNVTKHLHFPNFLTTSSLGTNFPQLKFLGNARVSEEKGVIQIPHSSSSQADQPTYQVGRAIYSSPIRLFDPLTLTPASFETTFSFQFTTNSIATRGGNGLAFVISPDEFTIGRPGPWLGILNDACNHYKVFAVEFDTNHDPQFGDPNDDHIGINLGAAVSFKTANLSEANISLHNSKVHRAWITYDGNHKHINIHLGLDGNPIPSKPILSSPLNLSPFLQEYMFVGFSASTGNSSQNSIHNILSWNFSSTVQASLHVPSTKICHRNVAHLVSKYSTTPHTNPPSSFLIFVALLVLSSVALLSFYLSRIKTNTSDALLFFDTKQRPMLPISPRRFTFAELYIATRRFDKAQVLATDCRGGSTSVLYRGTLVNGCQVAVKQFSTQFLSSPRVTKRLGDQITRASHPNLPNIRGWCCDGREAMIVYDHYPNGSLDRWLFGIGALPWTWRLKLVEDIAQGLSFLHSKQLSHGNLKASSVFLDVNYRPVLGDYGLDFFLPGSGRGSKGDVFGFGMLVLETVAGRKEEGLLGFAREMFEKGETGRVVDERMGDRVNSEEAVGILKIGLSCTASESGRRPCMEEVVQCLASSSHSRPIVL